MDDIKDADPIEQSLIGIRRSEIGQGPAQCKR